MRKCPPYRTYLRSPYARYTTRASGKNPPPPLRFTRHSTSNFVRCFLPFVFQFCKNPEPCEPDLLALEWIAVFHSPFRPISRSSPPHRPIQSAPSPETVRPIARSTQPHSASSPAPLRPIQWPYETSRRSREFENLAKSRHK